MYILLTFLANFTLAILIAAWPALAGAQGALEKKDVHVAVGGKASLYYLPLTIAEQLGDRKSTRLNSSHSQISYAVFCLKKKKKIHSKTKPLDSTHTQTSEPAISFTTTFSHPYQPVSTLARTDDRIHM